VFFKRLVGLKEKPDDKVQKTPKILWGWGIDSFPYRKVDRI